MPGAKLTRVVTFGNDGSLESQFPSKQLLEDPFSEVPGYGPTIRIPPFSLEQLVLLAESMPVHASCIEQKVLDIVGSGPSWLGNDDAGSSAKKQATSIHNWWESLSDEFTMLENLQTCWNDFETLGWGFLEVARDRQGKVRRLYHVPSHTMRAHTDGVRFAQIRHGRVMWFKRWGTDPTVDFLAKTGRPCDPSTDPMLKSNEILVFRKPTRRSTWYGIPTYISALGYIALAVSARDWNILFFENAREPRHLIIVSGMDEDIDKALDDLESVMRTQALEPHRNILLPIVGDANVTIQKMMVDNKDGEFLKIIEKSDSEVLISHRIPPDRLGISHVSGLVGGSTSQLIQTINAIYKEGVVNKGQYLVESRLDRFVAAEYERETGDKVECHTDLTELDISDANADAEVVIALVQSGAIELNEGRKKLGMEKRPEFKSFTLPEYLKHIGVSSPMHTGITFPSPNGLLADGTFQQPETAGDDPKLKTAPDPQPSGQAFGKPGAATSVSRPGQPTKPAQPANPLVKRQAMRKMVSLERAALIEAVNRLQNRLEVDPEGAVEELLLSNG